ncbi:MAG TPA: hypothetical protein PLL32_11400, partial [Anaeromyxobacteraceae bacterium]|nr:hypothetical protein [Anaeromyxobacteraceae bacterium]
MRTAAIAALAAALLLLGPAPAGAQVQAPTLVEGDLPADDARSRAARAGEAVPEPAQPPEPLPPPPAPTGPEASRALAP